MAISPSLTSMGRLKFGSSPRTTIFHGKYGAFKSRTLFRFFSIRAVQENEGPRRLVDIIRIVPEISRNYFKSPSRRALFGGISLLGGFYVAQTISLSFGALGVNDVIAAVLCVLLTEYATRFYYSRPKLNEEEEEEEEESLEEAMKLTLLLVKRKRAFFSWGAGEHFPFQHFCLSR